MLQNRQHRIFQSFLKGEQTKQPVWRAAVGCYSPRGGGSRSMLVASASYWRAMSRKLCADHGIRDAFGFRPDSRRAPAAPGYELSTRQLGQWPWPYSFDQPLIFAIVVAHTRGTGGGTPRSPRPRRPPGSLARCRRRIADQVQARRRRPLPDGEKQPARVYGRSVALQTIC